MKPITLPAHTLKMVQTDLQLRLPDPIVAELKERKVLSIKGVNVIGNLLDCHSRKNLKILFNNTGHEDLVLPPNTVVAALILRKLQPSIIEESEDKESFKEIPVEDLNEDKALKLKKEEQSLEQMLKDLLDEQQKQLEASMKKKMTELAAMHNSEDQLQVQDALEGQLFQNCHRMCSNLVTRPNQH